MTDLAPLWSLCSLNDDTLKDSTPSDFAFEYVDISNVTEGRIADHLESLTFGAAPSRARRQAQPNDVIISTVRTYLRAIAQVGEAESQRVYSTGFAVLRPVQGAVDPRYLAYILTSSRVMDEIIATSVGVSYPAIQGSALHRMRVPCADIDTQHAIADYLDRETGEIDAMIAKMDKLVETLELRRVAAVDEAFADSRSPVETAFQMVADVTVGIVIEPSKLYVHGRDGVPALRGLNVAPGRIVQNDIVQISPEGHQANLKSELREGDLVTVRTGQVGVTAIVPAEWDGANAIDLVITRPRPGVSSRYLYWFLCSSLSRSQMDTETVGAVQSHFNVSALKRLRMPMVGEDEQRRVADHLDEVTGRIDAMLGKVAELRSLLVERRAAIITDVVTGRKKVA
jgi:type I restriction enzyme S subunit